MAGEPWDTGIGISGKLILVLVKICGIGSLADHRRLRFFTVFSKGNYLSVKHPGLLFKVGNDFRGELIRAISRPR
jgi:hypothetical protein